MRRWGLGAFGPFHENARARGKKGTRARALKLKETQKNPKKMMVALSVVAACFCSALDLLDLLDLLDARTVVAILLAPACVAAVTLGALTVARLDDEHSVVARVALVVRAPPAECTVCLAHADAPVALACGHAFHAACLSRWLELTPTCPLCRASATMR